MDEAVMHLPDCRQLAYAIWGPRDGRPLVLHHGSPSSRLEGTWPPTFFEDRNILGITYDRPGYGRSTPQPGRSQIRPFR